jgi:3-hydroxyisobutyrate dehydrogenase-like beta-hydroxyacid dehydrogenase
MRQARARRVRIGVRLSCSDDAHRVIGVGWRGLPMCANLVRAGYEVTAGDARGERESAVTGCGARWKGTSAEVAAEVDVLITVLRGPVRYVT